MSDQPESPQSSAAGVLAAARRIAAGLLAPAAMQVEATQRVPASHLDALAAAGLYGIAGPPGYGGLDLDLGTACAVVEALAGACLSTAFVWLQHHGAVRAVAAGGDRLREDWLRPLCLGERRSGVALGGTLPGPARLRATPVAGGYLVDGISPWVTGWGYIDTLHVAARDPDDNVVWSLLDAEPGPALAAEPLGMVAVMASRTVQATFRELYVPQERVTGVLPLREWLQRDANGLRMNGSLALGVAARCCELAGPSGLDAELAAARAALDGASAPEMPAARARACELAARAAAALLVRQGSTSILLGQDAQRLAREAMFLLVFGSRPAIKHDLAGLLSAGRPR